MTDVMIGPYWVEHKPYFLLVENIICLAAQTATSLLIFHLLYCVRYRPARLVISRFSGSMSVFLCFHLAGALTGIFSYAHLAWAWRSDGFAYNADYMFWSGIFAFVYCTTSSVPVFFLTIERSIILKGALRANNKRVSHLSITIIVLSAAGFLVLALNQWPINKYYVSKCGELGSVYLNKDNIMFPIRYKLVFAVLNLGASVLFFYRMRYSGRLTSVANRIIKATIFMEFICAVLPVMGAAVFERVNKIQLFNYVGMYYWTLNYAEAAGCAAIYSIFFLRCFNRRRMPAATGAANAHSRIELNAVSTRVTDETIARVSAPKRASFGRLCKN